MKLMLCRIAVLAITLLLPGAAKADITIPLTAEQVACDQAQIERMLGRMRATALLIRFGYDLPTALFLSRSASTSSYEGLALANQFLRITDGSPADPVPPPEQHLAFHLNPNVRELLLNPARPPVGQVSLNREQSASNLVPPGGLTEVTLSLDPTLPGNPDPDLLVINNLEVPGVSNPYNGFLSNSTKPGRGLAADNLLVPCHTDLTAQDRKVFLVLPRMLRIRAELRNGHEPDIEAAIFRKEDAHTYGVEIDFFDLSALGGGVLGHVALELVVSWSPDGHLTSGTIRVLPYCANGETQGCTQVGQISTRVLLVPPVFAGNTKWNENDPRVVSLFFGSLSPIPAPAAVNFEDLLKDTTWNP